MKESILLIIAIGFLFGCNGGGGDGDDSENGDINNNNSNTISVGPNGGILEFPNGVILHIPDGAVSQETDIKIIDIQQEEVNEVLSARSDIIYEKRYIGGFSAEPDGLVFNSPIKVILPILPMEAGELPLQIDIDFNNNKFWFTKTNLSYLADRQMAEIEISHFSDPIVAAISGIDPKKLDEFCTDPYWNPKLSICQDFDELQDAYCLLKPEDRPEDAVCCKELSFDVEAEATDFSINRTTGECEILFDNVEVTYSDCTIDGHTAVPQIHSMGEISSHCPEDLILEINVDPSIINMFVCDSEQLTATITGRTSDGDNLFEDRPFQPVWTSDDSTIADVSHDGKVVGLSEGDIKVVAEAGLKSGSSSSEVLVNVRSNIRSFSVDPSPVTLEVDEERILSVELVDAFGNLLDASDVTWFSNNTTIADVNLQTGPLTSVIGVDKGSTSVVAEYEYDCEKVQAKANITVGCNPVKFTIDPAMVTLYRNEVMMLQATVLDMNDDPLDASAVTWTSANSDIVDVTIPEGELTSITGIKESPLPIRITATYNDGCQSTEAHAFVKVECFDLYFQGAAGGMIEAGTFRHLSVNCDPYPCPADLSQVTWSSSPPGIAAVIPSTGQRVDALGVKEGLVIITATLEDGICKQTADSIWEVYELEYNDIVGDWHLTPTSHFEQCRYDPHDWWPEDEFSSFDVRISSLSGGSGSIKADYIPSSGSFLTGSWDEISGEFSLNIDTSRLDECDYLFYESDICGDAIDCTIESCQNTTSISGNTSESVVSLEADSEWYSSVTFSYQTGPDTPRGQTTWECQGNATLEGKRK